MQENLNQLNFFFNNQNDNCKYQVSYYSSLSCKYSKHLKN